MSAVERLAEIQARLSAATPGPWAIAPWSPQTLGRADWLEWDARQNDAEPHPDGEFNAVMTTEDADARFIAAARSDVPALVAALRAVIEDAEQVIAEYPEDRAAVAQAGTTLDLIEKHLGGAE